MVPGGLLLAALAVAGFDWFAVSRGHRVLEYLCKPGVMLLLASSAVALHPASDSQRAWFVAALLLGAVGDVLLMLPRDLFLPGLLAFLLGHLAYAGGFLATGFSPPRALFIAVVLAAALLLILPRVLRGAAKHSPALAPAVAVYALAISAMATTAFASRLPIAVAPAILFLGSDALIAFRRFVSPMPWMPVTIMVTYHLAQVGLVLSLTFR